jgi:hypothetical protein
MWMEALSGILLLFIEALQKFKICIKRTLKIIEKVKSSILKKL